MAVRKYDVEACPEHGTEKMRLDQGPVGEGGNRG